MLHWIIHELILNYVLIGFLVWRIGRKWLYPEMDKGLDEGASRLQSFIYQSRIILRHWIAQRKGQGHAGTSLDCLEGDCAILNGQTYVSQDLQPE